MRFWSVLFLLFALVCGAAEAQSLTATPSSVNVSVGVGQVTTPDLEVVVSNPGAEVQFSAALQPNVNWASSVIIPPTSKLPANASIAAVLLKFNLQGLVQGNYSTTLVISAVGRPNLNVPVNLSVTAPSLAVDPSAPATFTQRLGTIAEYPFQVVYRGPGAVQVSLATAQSWVSVRPSVLEGFPASVSAQVNTTGLTPGQVYEATINFQATSAPSVPVQAVVLRVLVASSLSVQPKEVSFSGAPGSSTSVPPSIQITVSNFGPATSYSITPSASAPWLRTSKLGGTLAMNGSDTFDVRTDATSLSSTGEVVGTIEIGAPGRPSDIVTVRLQLSGAQDLTVSPATLSFAGQAGTLTSAPSQATVTVANSGQATGYTITVDQPWLVVSKNAGTVAQNGSDPFTVTASPQFQTVGTKTGIITVAAPGRAPRSVSVTFNVTATPPPPDLTVNPTSLSFSAQAGASTSVPSSSSVSVGNVGPAVGYTISADQPWVILDKLAGTIPENGSDNFPVRVSGMGQSVGLKTSTITVLASGRTARTITVTMNVTATDPSLDLTVTPGTMTFAGQAGTATAAPSAATATIRNVGAATSYTVAVNQPWLSVSKSGGTLVDNGTDTFTVSADPSLQTAGTKTGSVTISAAGRSPKTIAVTFTVTTDPPPPDLIVSPTSLSFSAAVGDTTGSPASETITLTNVGPAVGYALAADQTWIDLPSLSGSIATNGSATFTIGVKPQGQLAGTRTGTVSIIAPGRPARSVAVTMTVRDTPSTADMTVSPSAVSFVGQSGTPNGIPSNALVTINNAGAAVAYNLVPDQAWMVLSKVSGNLAQGGSDTFTVSANPLSQTPGLKSGTVTVQAAGRPSRTVQISFNVTAGEPATELLLVPSTMTFTGKVNQATATPARQTATITNVGAPVGYALFADKPWVTLSKLSGSIGQNSTDTFDVSVSATGLTAGTQVATISAAASGRATKTITVTFVVEAEVVVPTDMTASPSALSFTSVLGQSGGAPTPWKLTLTNVGPSTSYLATPDQPWIVLDNIAGALPADGSITLLVSVNPSFLPTTGARTGNILINALNRPARTVAVTLNVVQTEPAPDLVVLPASLPFTQPAGQTAPSPSQAMVQIGNVGAPIGYAVSIDQTWMTISKNSGNIGQNGTDSFNVSVNSAGLSAGTRTGTITVTAPGRPTRSVPVFLIIGGTGGQDSMSVTPTTLLTTGRVGDTSTTPLSTTVTVSNTGSSVQYAVTPNQSWIIASKLSGVLPANGTDTFTLSTVPLNLAIGTYTGTVLVTAPGRPQATINVTMVLTLTGQVTRIESFPPQVDFYQQSGFPVLGQSLRVTASDNSSTNVNVSATSSGWLTSAPGTIATPGQANLNVISSPSGLPLAGTVSLVPSSQGILTADVPVYLRDIGATYYSLPRIVDGGGFATTITIANMDSTPAFVTLRFRRVLSDTTTVSWTPSMQNNQSIENVTIPVNGSITWQTRGLGNQSDAGWAQIISAQKVSGFAIFRQSVPGRADQEAAVPVISIWQQRMLIPFDNTNNLVTSMAISNVSDSENGDVRAIFRDENGQVITGSYRKVLPPQGHTAFAMTEELPNLRNRKGTAEFVMVGGRMSALGLRFAAVAFTSFEAQSLNVLSTGRLIMPQVANGGGFVTTITLVNRDIVPAIVSLRFYRRTSTAGATEVWLPPMVNNQPTQNVTIPTGSSVSWQTTGTGDANSGWAEVIATQQVSGFAVYTQKVQGRFDQEASVPVNIGEQRHFLLPFDNTSPFTTTMALANFADDTQALIIATVRDEQNNVIGQQVPIIVPARGHLAFTLPERLTQTVGRRGTVDFSVSFGSVSTVGLRFAGEAFTSFRPQVYP